jgi:hypothetical protein
MADTCLVLGEKLEQKRIPDVSKHLPSTDYRLQHGIQFQNENPPRSERERERERENATVWGNILDFSLQSKGFQ